MKNERRTGAERTLAALSYLAFFSLLPLVRAVKGTPLSPYLRLHAGRGLLLFLFECIAMLLALAVALAFKCLAPSLISVSLLLSVALLLVFSGLSLVGILSALTGHPKNLPLTGDLSLLKKRGER